MHEGCHFFRSKVARSILAVVLILFAGFPLTSWALDITTRDGVTYRNCQDLRPENDKLAFTHSNGAARVVYENLPDALKSKYFDPAKIAAYRQQVQGAKDAAAAKVAAAERAREEAARKAQREQQQFIQETHDEEANRRKEMVDEQLAMKAADERPQKVLVALLTIMGLCIIAVPVTSMLKEKE